MAESSGSPEPTTTVYQNAFLPEVGTDVSVIVTVTCRGSGDGAGNTGGAGGASGTSGAQGAVRLRPGVARADEVTLDTASTRATRVRES